MLMLAVNLRKAKVMLNQAVQTHVVHVLPRSSVHGNGCDLKLSL